MTLRRRLTKKEILIAPGVFDALSATIAAQCGFEALYLSGAAVAYTRLGQPDFGLTTATEMAETLALISDKTSLPVIVDADTGFGNPLNARRTMLNYERAGAAALQVEDQIFPKKCGHLSNKSLISPGEMVAKISSMVDARSKDTLVIARTDAIAVEGLTAALDRATLYLEAGADVIFVEAPNTKEQLNTISKRLGGRAPLVANVVEGGRTPEFSSDELEEMGFDIVIFPGGIVRALAKTAREYYETLSRTGSTQAYKDRMYNFAELNDIIGLQEMSALDEKFKDIPGD